VKKDQIARLVRRIAHTLETELDCGDCAKHVPAIVDAVLAGQDTLDQWALIRQHFEECEVCSEEFAVLRNVARMELEGTWPTPAALLDSAARGELNA
jgi:hypothetical protein